MAATLQRGGRDDAIYRDDWKLILRSDGSRELYDLGHDPGELVDLAGERPGLAASLSAELDALRDELAPAWPAPPPVSVDEQTRDGLRALGYVE